MEKHPSSQGLIKLYAHYKELAEKALAQVKDEDLHRVLSEDGNSIAVLMQHIAGNLRSRFTDFLTSDGEKPWRDREGEFTETAADRAALVEDWNSGWEVFFREASHLTEADMAFDYVCCSVGTGGTISGLINSSQPHQKILGFPALKGDFLREEIAKFASQSNWELVNEYHFGGYAKINLELISFINAFKMKYKVPLDPIYTGKMMFGIFDMMKNGYFPKGSKILAIQTGGLQGIEGMNLILKQKHFPQIS